MGITSDLLAFPHGFAHHFATEENEWRIVFSIRPQQTQISVTIHMYSKKNNEYVLIIYFILS